MILSDRAPWRAAAACRGMRPDIFYPAQGETAASARAVCAGCPVRQPCLDYAVANERLGFWGGASERERAAMRRRRRRNAATALAGATALEEAS